MKQKGLFVLILVAIFALAGTQLYAKHSGGGYHGKSSCGGKGYHHDASLESKVFMKGHFLMMNQDEIGLTDEQIDKVKSIKMATKKNLILQDANIAVLKIDIRGMMKQDPVPMDEIDALIDQKYSLKSDRAKMLVSAYVDMKGVLSDEQKEKTKEIWMSQYKSK